MKKALLAVLMVVILAGGGLAIYHAGKSSNKPTQPNTNHTQNNSTNTQQSSSSATGTINITNMMFTPSQISIPKGGTVTWTNNDKVAHTIVADLGNGPDSGSVQPGSSYSYTFTKSGSYQYHCSIHPSMRGTIVVK